MVKTAYHYRFLLAFLVFILCVVFEISGILNWTVAGFHRCIDGVLGWRAAWKIPGNPHR